MRIDILNNCSEYEKIIEELLEDFSKPSNISEKKTFSLLYPIIGEHYEATKLLVYGRATNGWEWCGMGGWKLREIKTNNKRIIRDAKIMSSENWKRDEVKLQSAFWRLIINILNNIYRIPDNNSILKHFTWSNLMKIAPSKEGNPTNSEWRAQLPKCKELFKLEIDTLKPKVVLLITGFEWAFDFISNLDIDPNKSGYSDADFIKGVYEYNSSTIIVVDRPEFKIKDSVLQTIIYLKSIKTKF